MLEDQKLLLNQFFTLWAMFDPISHLPLFLGATADLSQRERRRSAVLAVLFSYGILLFFGIAGQHWLQAMGISLVSFQIAGGIILLLFSISMVLGQPLAGGKPAEEAGDSALAVAIYPLATPIIAGPGGMLVIILLTDNNRFTFSEQIATFGMLAIVLGMLAVIFILGDVIVKVVGRGGTNVMRRVMGVVLAALSINLILSALTEWLKLPPI